MDDAAHRCTEIASGALPVARDPFYETSLPPLENVPRQIFWVEDSKTHDRAVALYDGRFVQVDEPFRIDAFYAAPSETYSHGALGDEIEATALSIYNKSTTEMVSHLFRLNENLFFEDLTPRVVDLDGFGEFQVVTILTDGKLGASVAVFGIEDDKLTLLAQTPYIGTPNRWLNIAGIADFDGSGSSSIALVETPHIGGTLQFWRWSKGTLTKIAEAPGFSNHKFGSREQRLSAVEDFDNDGVSDLAVPGADRKSLKLVKLSGRKNPKVGIIAEIPLPAPIDKAIGVTRQGEDVVLTVGLEDGSVYAIHR